jgi:hypothetical protein
MRLLITASLLVAALRARPGRRAVRRQLAAPRLRELCPHDVKEGKRRASKPSQPSRAVRGVIALGAASARVHGRSLRRPALGTPCVRHGRRRRWQLDAPTRQRVPTPALAHVARSTATQSHGTHAGVDRGAPRPRPCGLPEHGSRRWPQLKCVTPVRRHVTMCYGVGRWQTSATPALGVPTPGPRPVARDTAAQSRVPRAGGRRPSGAGGVAAVRSLTPVGRLSVARCGNACRQLSP